MNWVEEIKNYNPYDEQEKRDKEIILETIDNFKNILTRENGLAHMTSSAFVLNKTRDKVLMIYHNIYDSWGWTGGHADGEDDLLRVAIKETREETGVKNVEPVVKDIISIDIIPVLGHIKKGKYVSAHLHLNVTYLLQGDETETLVIKEDENSGVKWIALEEISNHCSEPYIEEIYNKIIRKMRTL